MKEYFGTPESKFVCMRSEMNSEFTLCGDAFDLSVLDDAEAESPNFATPGALITCPNCRKQIAACKAVKRWRAPSGDDQR